MSTHYTVHWDDDQHTRYCLVLYQGWTWDDWIQGHIAAYREIAAVPHPVDFILALSHALPSGDSISCLRFARQKPNNLRRVVYVNSTGSTFEHTVRAIGQVLRWAPPHFTATLPEARAYLQQPPALTYK